ncbi:MAG: wax ester/triacylglycerol synthase family O-acyltransferase [Myxococcales bacterium]|nr:wax ester/triacylglycerol synthase family O-acyltransferase [Myxococcales bacterium]
MDKLSAIDTSFLYAETARLPMHVAALQIYDPVTAPEGRVAIADIVLNVRRRAHRIDCFHRKLLETPWNLDRPHWINDRDFDPSQHVSSVLLPRPGGWPELCEAVTRVAAQPLRRDRPLWEMHLITGLGEIDNFPRGAFAILTKIHHAAVDGVAGIAVTLALHDLEPNTADEPIPDMEAERVPGPTDLVAQALAQEWLRPAQLCLAWPEMARMTADSMAARPFKPPPPTRFNRRVSGRRLFDAIRIPLDELHACRALADGATVNDVVLAVVGGAMRRYLEFYEALPSRPLTAMIPISTRQDISPKRAGNQISQMIVGLGTDTRNAVDRLRAIHESSVKAKAAARSADAASLDEVAAFWPAPWLAFAARNWSQSPGNTVANTVITNVKGPPMPFYMCGAKLVKAYGMGPLADGWGTFHTALSYCGELTLSVLACAKLVPDIEFYTECLRAAYAELSAAAQQAKAPDVAAP